MLNDHIGRATLKLIQADTMERGSPEREQKVTDCLRELTIVMSEVCRQLDELHESHMVAKGDN